jgi:hypothetical protein
VLSIEQAQRNSDSTEECKILARGSQQLTNKSNRSFQLLLILVIFALDSEQATTMISF